MGERVYIADKPTLDKVYEILATEPVYGFIEHNGILDPTQRIEYIGINKDYTPISVNLSTGGYDLNDWEDFPWLKGNKPYMVKSDGTPDYRLDEDDYTKREDGSESDVSNADYEGGAFAWIPKIYRNEYMAGDDRYVMFRMEKEDGYEAIGFIDDDENELEGIWLPMYYGSILEDGRMSCISGTQPLNYLTTDQEKAAIDLFGERARFFGGSIVNTLIDLMLLLTKNCNLQNALGYGNRSGYDESDEYYGVLPNAVVDGGQFYGTNDTKSLNKVFHSLVLITQNQHLKDPYTIVRNGEVMVSPYYKYDVSGASYQDTGIYIEAPEKEAWVYPHKWQSVPHFGSFPVYPWNGSTSTGTCDGLYRTTAQATSVRIARRFGYCNHGALGGPRCITVNYTASSTTWRAGAAVLLLPPVGVAV